MSTLGAVVVGGIIGFVSAIGVKLWEGWRFKRNLRAAYKAEIQTILELSEARDYEGHFREYLEAWEKGQRLDSWPTIIGYEEKQKYPIAEANVGNIGHLGNDVAPDVVKFYMLLQGIETDISAAARHKLDHFGPEQRIGLVKEDLRLWGEVRSLADGLIKKL